jgi:hypothetical protein
MFTLKAAPLGEFMPEVLATADRRWWLDGDSGDGE